MTPRTKLIINRTLWTGLGASIIEILRMLKPIICPLVCN